MLTEINSAQWGQFGCAIAQPLMLADVNFEPQIERGEIARLDVTIGIAVYFSEMHRLVSDAAAHRKQFPKVLKQLSPGPYAGVARSRPLPAWQQRRFDQFIGHAQPNVEARRSVVDDRALIEWPEAVLENSEKLGIDPRPCSDAVAHYHVELVAEGLSLRRSNLDSVHATVFL